MTTPDSQSCNDVTRERVVSAANGYAELGLPEMAWDEVNSLPDGERSQPCVQEVILGLLIRQHRWEEAVLTGHRLCAMEVCRPSIYIHTAYALHETGRTSEAQAILLAGPESLRKDPLYHYNLACYLAVAGNLKDAETALRIAFHMDESLRLHARIDPDLKCFKEIV